MINNFEDNLKDNQHFNLKQVEIILMTNYLNYQVNMDFIVEVDISKEELIANTKVDNYLLHVKINLKVEMINNDEDIEDEIIYSSKDTIFYISYYFSEILNKVFKVKHINSNYDYYITIFYLNIYHYLNSI